MSHFFAWKFLLFNVLFKKILKFLLQLSVVLYYTALTLDIDTTFFLNIFSDTFKFFYIHNIDIFRAPI